MKRQTTGGNGKTRRAVPVCHGAPEGMGLVPGTPRRSPSYTVRQFRDTQHGTRKGIWADLMKPVVASLTNDDMPPRIAAHRASRQWHDEWDDLAE